MAETFVREGYRPMLDHHKAVLEAGLREGRPLLVIEDASFGAIAVAQGAVLMIQAGDRRWTFPKGHPNDGELPELCAVREVLEETAVDITGRIDTNTRIEENYTYAGRLNKDRWEKHTNYPDESKRPVTVFHKTVRYYLAVLDAPVAVTPQEEEVHAVAWVPVHDAIARLQDSELVALSGFLNEVARNASL